MERILRSCTRQCSPVPGVRAAPSTCPPCLPLASRHYVCRSGSNNQSRRCTPAPHRRALYNIRSPDTALNKSDYGLMLPSLLTASPISFLHPTSEAPSVSLAIAAFFGLPAALWAYKCLMMVVFQRKIIYMGYAPPGARTESLGADVPMPKGLTCEELHLESEKGITLYGIDVRKDVKQTTPYARKVVVVYLQGNAGNSLARLPVFETLLHGIRPPSKPSTQPALDVSIVAVAPRSYWKSSSRTPTQRGILADYTAALSYATRRYPDSTVVLYGHSLGGAVAVCLAASLSADDYPSVKGLILENPFSSIGGMVQALYPQRWLPYRYLAPLAFDKWDAVTAVRETRPQSLLARLSKDTLVLLSEKDEVVPTSMGMELYAALQEKLAADAGDASATNGLCRQVVIRGALHERAWLERQWVSEMGAYMDSISKCDKVS
ncbi:Alpha/Beta hydrolase protein [Rhodofomes roseus]|uniref:Alpha/Beta hydrolase protein n=1 Tax=Rhodofomes roseus TaxID=34475 RepID=A0ABQ8KT34_9APHY|nr:Alpha/Beta hydrolase protein [Rhodofomes roseus]KAH9841709.1 Alpha/Beta hydrolase protein [Rhodofomes roseus]